MKNLLVILSFTLMGIIVPHTVKGVEYELDFNVNTVDHGWRAKGTDRADWKLNTKGVGFTVWFDEHWGARLMYTKGSGAKTDGRYSDWNLDYQATKGFEIKYRQEIFEGFTVFVGAGTWKQPLPIYRPDGTMAKDDTDNDEGLLAGISYEITEHWGATYQWTQQSRITDKAKNLDEWIITQSAQVYYRF